MLERGLLLRCLLISQTALFSALSGGSMAANEPPVPADATIDSVVIRPYLATNQDSVVVQVCGTVPGAINGIQGQTYVNGLQIHVYVDVYTNPQVPYFQSWCSNTPLGQLGPGSYSVFSVLTVNGSWAATRQTPMPISPPRFCWGDRSSLTTNSVSDAYPATAVFNDKLYVFWNQTYDGSLVYATYDGSHWSRQTTISDCTTRSAIGAAIFNGRLYVFYSKSTGYPTSHLFYVSSPDGIGWAAEQEVTTGSVYDDFGASAVVHDSHLIVFWKRWQNDGNRYIYSMSYDGSTWGAPTLLWSDGYINAPAGPASFQGKLYVFYGGGVLYRVFNGAAWSVERTASHAPPDAGSDGSSPASVIVGGRLKLLVVSDDKQLYSSDFDGSSWTEARISEQPETEVLSLNLAAALFRGKVYLIWGGSYADPTDELHARLFVDADADSVSDACDDCPAVYDPAQIDQDGDRHGAACDCDDADPATWPAAPESNDGRDNQCPGDPGYGSVDEISGFAGFPDPADRTGFCWSAQPGASAYEARRSSSAAMTSPCTGVVTAGLCWRDPDTPPTGDVSFYLVRPSAPHAGSWGRTSAGAERVVCP